MTFCAFLLQNVKYVFTVEMFRELASKGKIIEAIKHNIK